MDAYVFRCVGCGEEIVYSTVNETEKELYCKTCNRMKKFVRVREAGESQESLFQDFVAGMCGSGAMVVLDTRVGKLVRLRERVELNSVWK